MDEPLRRLPDPALDQDGNLHGRSVTTPETMKLRGALAVPPSRVIPVIVVPGTMGSNLRATTDESRPRNAELQPGEPAWRPPNGKLAGLQEASKWKGRNPKQRQLILDPETLEVDNGGEIDLPSDLFGMHAQQMRKRWWGEVHWDSYGELLYRLQNNLNHTFEYQFHSRQRMVREHWREIIDADRAHWDATGMPALTEAELERYARFQYPVYACGYNWLQSNGQSAERLKQRVLEIIRFWSERKHACRQVILVTHSMGGLVARACAKQIPDQIAGIVHGVMPALGAPLCYRRIACGTEASAPGNGRIQNLAKEKFAEIAGKTPQETMPVMATAPGVLELLPNHLYPEPWLHVSVRRKDGQLDDVLTLPEGNPYDLYRDLRSWYRLIDPAIADPAEKYKKDPEAVERTIWRAVDQAERFHTQILGDYYHPNTYAYYGADEHYRSFGAFRWIVPENGLSMTPGRNELLKAEPIGHTFTGGRNVSFTGSSQNAGRTVYFTPSEQDVSGDGTVPYQSGAGPRGKVKRVFRTTGYEHQGSYNDEHMLRLTQYLIAKIAQEAQ